VPATIRRVKREFERNWGSYGERIPRDRKFERLRKVTTGPARLATSADNLFPPFGLWRSAVPPLGDSADGLSVTYRIAQFWISGEHHSANVYSAARSVSL
jgi:hypothetical protein